MPSNGQVLGNMLLVFLAIYALSPFPNLLSAGKKFQANDPRNTLAAHVSPRGESSWYWSFRGVCAHAPSAGFRFCQQQKCVPAALSVLALWFPVSGGAHVGDRDLGNQSVEGVGPSPASPGRGRAWNLSPLSRGLSGQ